MISFVRISASSCSVRHVKLESRENVSCVLFCVLWMNSNNWMNGWKKWKWNEKEKWGNGNRIIYLPEAHRMSREFIQIYLNQITLAYNCVTEQHKKIETTRHMKAISRWTSNQQQTDSADLGDTRHGINVSNSWWKLFSRSCCCSVALTFKLSSSRSTTSSRSMIRLFRVTHNLQGFLQILNTIRSLLIRVTRSQRRISETTATLTASSPSNQANRINSQVLVPYSQLVDKLTGASSVNPALFVLFSTHLHPHLKTHVHFFFVFFFPLRVEEVRNKWKRKENSLTLRWVESSTLSLERGWWEMLFVVAPLAWHFAT